MQVRSAEVKSGKPHLSVYLMLGAKPTSELEERTAAAFVEPIKNGIVH